MHVKSQESLTWLDNLHPNLNWSQNPHHRQKTLKLDDSEKLLDYIKTPPSESSTRGNYRMVMVWGKTVVMATAVWLRYD